jgi:hypothetical protein
MRHLKGFLTVQSAPGQNGRLNGYIRTQKDSKCRPTKPGMAFNER